MSIRRIWIEQLVSIVMYLFASSTCNCRDSQHSHEQVLDKHPKSKDVLTSFERSR